MEKILAKRVFLGDPELPGTILRWPVVYGPRDPLRRLQGYLRRMDAGRPTILLDEGLTRWRCTRVYCENVAHAVVLAVTAARAVGRVYNVGEAEALRRTVSWERAHPPAGEPAKAAEYAAEDAVLTDRSPTEPPHCSASTDCRRSTPGDARHALGMR